MRVALIVLSLIGGWLALSTTEANAVVCARGIYRDPVRSSDSHFVKTSGLRWLSLMLLVDIPWAGRVWALPFLTALAPSERYWQLQGRQPKLLTVIKSRAHSLPASVRRLAMRREMDKVELRACLKNGMTGTVRKKMAK